MHFLDEDEPYAPAPGEAGPPVHYSGDRRRQILFRRAVALGVGVLVLILIVLGVKGCLNARKERGFENYASDLSSYVAQSKQLSDDFFGRLTDPGNLTELSFEAEVSADRGSAEGLLQNVENLDTPDELNGAQVELELAFELRRDGLAGVAEQIPSALGDESRTEAIEAIAGYMRYFLASDVLYARARSEINQVLDEEGIDARVPESVFMPSDPEQFLNPLELGTALTTVAGGREATSGVHGLGLLQTTVNPGGVILDAGAPATVSGGGPFELEIQVQNQGESQETDITVTYQLSGGTTTIEGDATIPRIEAGAIETATLPISPDPPGGESLSLEVVVSPVLGEQVEDNNTATYEVTFG